MSAFRPRADIHAGEICRSASGCVSPLRRFPSSTCATKSFIISATSSCGPKRKWKPAVGQLAQACPFSRLKKTPSAVSRTNQILKGRPDSLHQGDYKG